MVTNNVNTLKLRKCTRNEFVAAITTDKADSFAKTFVSKADMQSHWDRCLGAFNDSGELMGAIITTVGKRDPKVANLQLLHTFNKHRRKGVAKELTLTSFAQVSTQAIYFRVSAEPSAVAFYESIGFKFWGLQKSRCSLSMFKINGGSLRDGIYNEQDPFLQSALYSGKKGSLACSYKVQESVDLNAFL